MVSVTVLYIGSGVLGTDHVPAAHVIERLGSEVFGVYGENAVLLLVVSRMQGKGERSNGERSKRSKGGLH
jgi:hypothetical protein